MTAHGNMRSHFVMYCRDAPIELLSFGQRGSPIELEEASLPGIGAETLSRPVSPSYLIDTPCKRS